jgi:hypothetical protein
MSEWETGNRPKPSAQELLAAVRNRAREALVPGRVDVRALLEEAEGGAPTGRISSGVFFKTLAKRAGLVFDEKSFILKRFGNHKRIINYAR